MTRPKRPAGSRANAARTGSARRGPNTSGSQPQAKGSRGHAPKKMSAQGRGGITRDSVRPVRETTEDRVERQERQQPTSQGLAGQNQSARRKPQTSAESGATIRRYGSAGPVSGAGKSSGGERKAPPKVGKKPLPELKRVQLNAPAPDTQFVDRDGQRITFPDSNLRRVAAQILTDFRKSWRYRAFDFPLFSDRGHEQAFHFDFYIYDAEDSVIRLILVVPHESREVWDKVGRFKRQYPMYTYELWTPEKLAALSGPRGKLGW